MITEARAKDLLHYALALQRLHQRLLREVKRRVKQNADWIQSG